MIMNKGTMMTLSDQEKMRAAAEIHLARGEALMAAAGGASSKKSSSLFPQDSMLGIGAGFSSLNDPLTNPMAMSRTSSLLDGVGSFGDRSFLMGMNSGMSSLNPLSDIGMPGMGLPSTLRSREVLANAELFSAAENNQLKMERMMMMRRYEAMMLAEERARMETLEMGMKLRTASTSVVTPGSELDSETTLAALGNSMRKKSSPYIDASAMADPPEFELARRRTRGGVTEPFPEKLHRMLLEIEKDGNSHIISFFPHGRAFGIHDTEKFEKEIMPKYFKQSRLSSFQRQLNLYGFTRIVSGPDASGYYHELFLKGRPALCTHMRRVGIPKGVDRRKIKTITVTKKEPDFYSMRPSI